MSPVLVTLICFVLYLGGYYFYSKHLAFKVFRLDPTRTTPAHTLYDSVDYVPTQRFVLFGHHYASIAGLSPMLGPAIAVIWGWLPALIWVVVGTIFIGAVHDFSAMVVSVRAKGMSVGKVAEKIIGFRAKILFHLIIFFLIALAMGVFVHVTATLLGTTYHPEAIYPSGTLMLLALVVGLLVYKYGFSLAKVPIVALFLTLGSIWMGLKMPLLDLGLGQWSIILLSYGFLASVLPVWLLIQPRDYINSLLLYAGLISIFAGFFLLQPQFSAPVLQIYPEGAPPMFPFVFIVIACGSISGFHGLVSSGTTAKQINSESDTRFIGYGGMIGESLLGLVSVLACTAGFSSSSLWHSHYQSWALAQGLGANMKAFIDGCGHFLNQLGIPFPLAKAFIALIAISFALTTLDSAVRLLRFNITEMSETLRLPILGNRYASSALAVLTIGFFAFYEIGGRAAGLALWQLFGTTNQILASLTLLAVTLYLMQKRRNYWFTAVPMLFMMITTLVAMTVKMVDFWNLKSYVLLCVGGIILILSLWLAVEAISRILEDKRSRLVKG